MDARAAFGGGKTKPMRINRDPSRLRGARSPPAEQIKVRSPVDVEERYFFFF